MDEKAGPVHYVLPLRIVAPPGVQVPSCFDPFTFFSTWQHGGQNDYDSRNMHVEKSESAPLRNLNQAEGASFEFHHLGDDDGHEGNRSRFIFDRNENGERKHIPRRCRTSRNFKSCHRRSGNGFYSSENGGKPDSCPEKAGNCTQNGRKPYAYPACSKRVAESARKFETYPASSGDGHADGPSSSSSPRNAVINTLRLYHALWRHFMYEEECAGRKSGKSKLRADLNAGNIINNKGLAVNKGHKIVGSVPGVEVGDIFYFRMEIACVGMHSPLQSGIDYLSASKSTIDDVAIAISIISSGGYDARDDGEVLIYTGQGGRTATGNQKNDQKLVRGNLALEGNMKHSIPVRVIRGIKDVSSPTGKIYTYDGLYKVEDCWTETSKSGFEEFKFKLRRMPLQPALASNSLKASRALNCSTREHMRVVDISNGKESQPVCVVNSVDDESCPTGFVYMRTMESYHPKGESGQQNEGCNCLGHCKPSPTCACFRQNCHVMPYLQNGILLKERGLIYECGSHCKCSESCQNRVTQKPPKFHLEIFKKEDRGWGLRSWDSIPAGSFICEYTGRILTSDVNIYNRNYILNVGALPKINNEFWGHVSTHMESYDWQESTNTKRPKIIIDSSNCGNAARFINHSCLPNVLVQCVSRNQSNFHCVMLFAMDNILPFTELTLNYGSRAPTALRKQCICNGAGCRGTFHS